MTRWYSIQRTPEYFLQKNQNAPRPSEQPTRQTILHVGQSRLWFAKQAKQEMGGKVICSYFFHRDIGRYFLTVLGIFFKVYPRLVIRIFEKYRLHRLLGLTLHQLILALDPNPISPVR